MLFLINAAVVDPDPAANPANNPAFPLPADRFAALRFEDILFLAKTEFLSDPDFPHTKPKLAAGLAGLLIMKGRVNALRLSINDPAAGAAGVGASLADLSIEVMADLVSKQAHGALTLQYVDLIIWSQIRAA
ncbi:MAG: hypothetical protein AAGL49_11155 [Pseudomonadota bacterium]